MFRKLALGAAAAGSVCLAILPSVSAPIASCTAEVPPTSGKSSGTSVGTKKKKEAKRDDENAEKALQKDRRTIFLSGEVNDQQYRRVGTALLHLSARDPAAPITLIINSGGGSVTAGMGLYDLMKLVPSPVHTLCNGRCSSVAAVLLAGGEPGQRRATPSARVMLHEAARSSKATLKVSDFDLVAAELRAKNALTQTALAADCGYGSVERLLEQHEGVRRDYFMSASEAMAFGVVDAVAGRADVAALLASEVCIVSTVVAQGTAE